MPFEDKQDNTEIVLKFEKEQIIFKRLAKMSEEIKTILSQMKC